MYRFRFEYANIRNDGRNVKLSKEVIQAFEKKFNGVSSAFHEKYNHAGAYVRAITSNDGTAIIRGWIIS